MKDYMKMEYADSRKCGQVGHCGRLLSYANGPFLCNKLYIKTKLLHGLVTTQIALLGSHGKSNYHSTQSHHILNMLTALPGTSAGLCNVLQEHV